MAHLVVAAPISLDTIGDTENLQLGGAIYSARTAAALGHRSLIVGPVGEDCYARAVATLSSARLDTTGLIVGPWPTRRVLISEPDEVVEQSTWVEEVGEPDAYDDAIIEPLLGDADVILTYGHAPGLALAALRAAPTRALRAVDLQDLTSAATPILSRSSWAFVSWPSASELADSDRTEEVITRLRTIGATNLVLKLGPGGALIVPAVAERVRVPALLGSFRNTVGAGDAFNSAFITELAAGASIRQAADIATAAAAYLIEANWPSFGTREDLRAIRSRRLPVFCMVETRRDVNVLLLVPGRTAAECLFKRRLSGILANHEFPHRVIDALVFEDQVAVLRSAHVAIAVLDGEDPLIIAALEELTRFDMPIIAFWGSGISLPKVAAVGDAIVHDERELVAALYAFAGEGREGLMKLTKISTREG